MACLLHIPFGSACQQVSTAANHVLKIYIWIKMEKCQNWSPARWILGIKEQRPIQFADNELMHWGWNFLHYRISPNKCAGRGGRKLAFVLVWCQWNWQCAPLNTSPLSAEKMIQIGYVVSEILSVKVQSRGRVYPSRRVYSAKYGLSRFHRTSVAWNLDSE